MGSGRAATGPAGVTAWILFSAYCSCAGWVLSAFHQLHPTGYAVAFLLGAVAYCAVRWGNKSFRHPAALIPHPTARRLRRRFGRAFPLGFLVLASLAILGGVLNAPSNYDALTYRIPRVLHWLAAGQWHWIYTGFQRVNTRACGIEWLSAPLIALTRTERWLFVINAASFLLLPGLVFSVFCRGGVRPRAAWH